MGTVPELAGGVNRRDDALLVANGRQEQLVDRVLQFLQVFASGSTRAAAFTAAELFVDGSASCTQSLGCVCRMPGLDLSVVCRTPRGQR